MSNDGSKLDLKRRGFLSGGLITFGAAGLASLGLPTPSKAAELPVLSDAIDPVDTMDPPAPPNMKKGAQLDARFPVSYRRSVPQACRVMAAHFDAIATRDYKALARTMQFPFAIVERIDVVVVNSPSDLTDSKAPGSLNFSPDGQFDTNHFSRLKPGCYDILISLEVLNFDPLNVTMAMTFDRYNKHGLRILRCEGVYAVTNNEGHWGIQLMSTIFTPDDLIGHQYEDAKQAAVRLRANHLVSYIDDDDIIDRPRATRGPRAGIIGGGIGNLFESQEGDDPMAQFKVKGVKTRLSVSGQGNLPPGLQPAGGGGGRRGANAAAAGGGANAAAGGGGRGGNADPNALDPALRRADREPHVPKWKSIIDNYNQLGVNFYEGAIDPATRIVHHTADKVHRISGAARYTTAGELISISQELGVVVLGTQTDWVGNATFRYVTTHDRNNDDKDS